MEYTLAQVRALCAGHVLVARAYEVQQIAAIRMAVWADAADIKAHFQRTGHRHTPTKTLAELSQNPALRPALAAFGFPMPPQEDADEPDA